MLHNVKELSGFTMGARDGELGKVKDVYFDDQRWVDPPRRRRHRRLAQRPQGADLATIGARHRLERRGAQRRPHAAAGAGQPRHRHRPAGLAPARDRLLPLFRLSELLGGRESLGSHDAAVSMGGRIGRSDARRLARRSIRPSPARSRGASTRRSTTPTCTFVAATNDRLRDPRDRRIDRRGRRFRVRRRNLGDPFRGRRHAQMAAGQARHPAPAQTSTT